MSTWGNDSRLKLTEEAITAFEQANPGITVQVENSEFSSYWDKLATQTAANDPPDVIQMDEAYIAAYGGRGALLDLSTKSSVLDLSAMDAKVLDTGKVAGTLVGAPVGVALFSVGVNPELLKQAGLKMPDDKTWTWDDLATMASTVTQKLGSKGVVGMDFFGVSAAEIGVWARQRNQEVFPVEGQTAVTSETLVSYFEFAKRWWRPRRPRRLAARSRTLTEALDSSRFATNKAAFHLQFHTQIAAFVAASGSDLQLLRLPAQASGKSAAHGQQGVDVLVDAGQGRALRGSGQAGQFLDDRPCGSQDPQGRAGCSCHRGGPVPDRAGTRCHRQDVVDVRSGPAGRGGSAAAGDAAERIRVRRRGDPDRHRRAVRSEDSGRRRGGVAGGDQESSR